MNDDAKIARDVFLWGTGFGRRRSDGTIEHIPCAEMVVERRGSTPSFFESLISNTLEVALVEALDGWDADRDSEGYEPAARSIELRTLVKR